MAIITTDTKGGALSVAEMNANLTQLDTRTAPGWKDLLSSMSNVGVPDADAPSYEAFGPSGLRRELAFDVGDYAYSKPFHVGHDIKVGGLLIPHVHWSTSGASTLPVKWEFQISRAIGHQQAYFTAEISLFATQAGWGGAWRHMIAEVPEAQALHLIEPDELLLLTLRRVPNGGTENPDRVFGLLVDFHYEADRDATPNRAPNFYA
jgi:hypothetical protein